MSLLKQLAGQTIYYGLSKILPQILHFLVFTIYLSHKVSQDEFGIYLDLYAYAAIILVIMTYRMETAFFRFGSEKANQNSAFGTAMLPLILIVFLIVALMFVYNQQLANLINYDHKPYYIKWFALILGFDALMALPYARMRLDNQPKKFLFYRVANVLVTVLIVLFCFEIMPSLDSSIALLQFDQKNQIDYVFGANLIASTFIFLLMLKEFFKVKIQFDSKLWKKMFWYSLPLVLVGIAGNINQSFAAPIQKYFLGESIQDNLSNAGVYGAAAKMALLLNLFTVAFNYAAEPFFFNNAKRKDAKQVYGTVALAFCIVACAVIVGLSAYMDIVGNILGSDFRSGLHVVPILLFAYLFLGLYYNFSIWYKLDDKTYWGAIISVIGAFITLAVSIYLLPKIGYIGSAWAALCCYGFMAFAGWLTGKKYYPIHYPILKILSYIVLTLIIVVSLQYLNGLGIDPILLFAIKGVLILVFSFFAWKKDLSKIISE